MGESTEPTGAGDAAGSDAPMAGADRDGGASGRGPAPVDATTAGGGGGPATRSAAAGADEDAVVGQRFRREVDDVKEFVHQAKRGRVKPAERALDALGDELRGELLGRESYVPLLVLTLTSIILIPLLDTFVVGRMITLVLVAAILLITMSRSAVRPRTFRRALVATGLATGLGLAGLVAVELGRDPNRWLVGTVNSVFAVLILVTLPAILRRVFLHPRITVNTLAAAVSAYLLLGLFFTFTFRVMSEFSEQPFFAQKANDAVDIADFEYFSFITITTVGYGDLTPSNNLARAGAVSEAVIGQIFLVTIVARVVGQLGQQRTQDPEVLDRYRRHYDHDPPPGPEPDPPDPPAPR